MEEESLGKFYDGRLLKRLLGYLRPYRGAVFLAVACMLLDSAAQIAGPLLTKIAIDRYLAPAVPVERAVAVEGMIWICALYLGALLAQLSMQFAQSYIMARTGQSALFDLRRDTMSHLQKLDLSYYDKTPVGRLLTRVTTDADALNELFASGLVTLMGDLIMIAATLVVMFQLSPGLTLALVLSLPPITLVTIRFRRDVLKSNRRIRTAVARINAFLQEHISGMAVLQLFNREARGRADFEAVNRDHMEAYKESIIAYGWFYPAVEFISMTTVAALLAYGGYRVRDGGLSLGVLVAFFQYGLRFFRPIQDLSEKYNILVSSGAAAERVFQLLDTQPAIRGGEARVPEAEAPVEFDRVWFAYKGEDWVLRDVSFRIEPGETIAVVGHTGAGKTTLTNLLLRFYDIQKGSIRIGGRDIRELPLGELRKRFAVVLQDSFLFTGTVEDNIRLGTRGIDDGRIRAAVDQVNLSQFVQSLPEGLRHPVRERGAGLSTGQKQLISFARALAHDPSFLILDEATSSVDTETEIRIREAVDQLVKGRTSLIIAHRLSTIQRATRIFVLHKGQLRETGTHQQLLALRGIYWKLYQLQYKEQEIRS